MAEESPLFHAVLEGNLELIRDLIARGLDCNAIDSEAYSVLMRAVRSMNRTIDIVELLLQSGANVHDCTPDDDTALILAIDVDSNSSEPDSVPKILTALVRAGADIEARNRHGWTALVKAVMEGTATEMAVLIKLGADPFVVGFETFHFAPAGSTLLHASVGSPDKVRLLLNAGLDVNAQTKGGFTVLEEARYWAAVWDSRENRRAYKTAQDCVNLLESHERARGGSN